jgi:hypothetical protein
MGVPRRGCTTKNTGNPRLQTPTNRRCPVYLPQAEQPTSGRIRFRKHSPNAAVASPDQRPRDVFVFEHHPLPPKNKKPSRKIGTASVTLSVCSKAAIDYLMISVTWPAPTVRPPSRIANFRPFSIAIGAISLTSRLTLSPGITISTPAGSSHSPVTSVVRK